MTDLDYIKETAQNFGYWAYQSLANVREVDTDDFEMLVESALDDFATYEFWEEADCHLVETIIRKTIKKLISGEE
jgi:hypothetical protein